jgi:hypothetical protein
MFKLNLKSSAADEIVSLYLTILYELLKVLKYTFLAVTIALAYVCSDIYVKYSFCCLGYDLITLPG